MSGAPVKKFYVYSLTDPRDLSVFYLGKGTAARSYAHTHNVELAENDTSPKAERIREIISAGEEVISTILKRFSNEEEAYTYETKMIEGQPNLLNKMAGGSGRRTRSKQIRPAKQNHKLTVKQEMFCLQYVENGGNASEAYRYAYDVGENTKIETVWRKAKEVIDNGKVSARVKELMHRHRKRNDVSVDNLTEKYERAYNLAEQTAQPAAMNGSVQGIARLHGLITDKHQHEVSIAVGFADRLNEMRTVDNASGSS